MTAADSAEAQRYDPRAVQEKWQSRWAELDPFRASDDPADPRERAYLLDMFPYPSGDLHMGHAEAYAIGDAMARYWFQLGRNVLHPIGWDAFGLPAENAAIRNNAHPADWTYANIETQAESFKRYAVSFDWSRRLATCDPDYYRWNQWLFLRFYERELAYRKDGYVNWCPKDQTVLANEQVINGRCERCGTEVIRRTLTQWYFRITSYADQLLADAAELEGKWPERVLLMQRNWIGRSEGAEVEFQIEGRDEPVTVFTTRPDTLYGATFFVVAADSPLAAELVAPEQRDELQAYVDDVRKLTDIERQATGREKTGVFLGVHAINPVNDEPIPVWAADYVLPDYGTGAIMAVPAHDQRDLDFARAFGLPVRVVVDTGQADPAETGIATPGEGELVNSGPLDGLAKGEAIAKIMDDPGREAAGPDRGELPAAGLAAVPAAVLGHPDPDHPLPGLRRGPGAGRGSARGPAGPARPGPRAQGRVAAGRRHRLGQRDLPQVRWPGQAGHRHHGHVRRLVLVLPALLLAARRGRRRSTRSSCAEWAPVDLYVGGVEHAILHLLYSRFFVKVLHDMGMVEFREPFTRMLNQGQVINGGKAMSKSLGNGVDLGQQLAAHGVDAIRLTMIFASPPEDDIDWADVRPEAMVKFLGRAWRLADRRGRRGRAGRGDGERR